MTGVAVIVLALLVAAAARRAVVARAQHALKQRLIPAEPMATLHLAGHVAARVARRRGESARVERDLPLALEALARSLRTGASLRQAVTEAAAASSGPLADDLARVAARTDRGTPLVAALESWAAERPLAGVRLASAALSLGAETGGAQARAIDGVAATLRERLAAAAEVRAQATQARVSAAVIAVAPLAFCTLATASDARTAAFLFKTPVGLALLASGLGLDGLGALWMSRLTRVRP